MCFIVYQLYSNRAVPVQKKKQKWNGDFVKDIQYYEGLYKLFLAVWILSLGWWWKYLTEKKVWGICVREDGGLC